MTLANMRENGVGSVVATCAKCQHEGVLEVQRWSADTPVPDDISPAALRQAFDKRARVQAHEGQAKNRRVELVEQ